MAGINTASDFAAMAAGQGRSLPQLSKTTDMAAARKTAKDFEAVFASQMLGQMFAGIKTDSLFGGGDGEEMFRSMLFDEYGKQIARHGSLGIADAVMRTLLSAQEKTR